MGEVETSVDAAPRDHHAAGIASNTRTFHGVLSRDAHEVRRLLIPLVAVRR